MVEAYMEIARELVALGDDLPTLTQCVIDINSGTYAPSYSAVLATGGEVEQVLDEATGQPVQVLVKEEQVIGPE